MKNSLISTKTICHLSVQLEDDKMVESLYLPPNSVKILFKISHKNLKFKYYLDMLNKAPHKRENRTIKGQLGRMVWFSKTLVPIDKE